ncbi:MAG: hypothetical protein GEV08_25740, partial [Acidimicrobiia bacterium]|nr:hypothetical protein [Acidimicrobiia bacterium]
MPRLRHGLRHARPGHRGGDQGQHPRNHQRGRRHRPRAGRQPVLRGGQDVTTSARGGRTWCRSHTGGGRSVGEGLEGCQDRRVTSPDWAGLDAALTAALHPTAPPVAITFGAEPPAGVAHHDGPMPAALTDGRTGRVPAGCVFWMHATDRTFTTTKADHGNCSVGSLTHGFATLDEVAGNDDVAALVGSGWVSMEDVPSVPVVSERPGAVTYGPLADTPVEPDVVLVRLTAKSLMVLCDALP